MAFELDPALLEPIPGDSPAGPSIRYDPVYDRIKLARTEEEDLPRGGWDRDRKTADHRTVIKLATETLEKKSKDLQIAAWLAEALTHREGLPGLATGIRLVRELCERFWDDIHPELEDGDAEMRAVPLSWMGLYLDDAVRRVPLNAAGHNLLEYRDSRLIPTEEDAESDSAKAEARQKAIEEGKLPPETFDDSFDDTPKSFYKGLSAALDDTRTELDALDGLGQDRIEDSDVVPSYYKLRAALDDLGQAVKQLLAKKLEQDPDPVEAEELAEPEAPRQVESGEAALVSPAGGPVVAAGAVSAKPRSRDDAASRVAAAAAFMRAESPTDPSPYLMLRGLRWGELRASGGRIDPRLLAAPPTDVRTRLKSFLLDAQWAELLEAGEGVMATPYGRGWLDLQRYVLTACAGLGGEYDVVAGAVRGALGSLLQDLPGLLDLTLMDDSPTANRETRAWLAESGILAESEEGAASAAEIRATPARAGRDVWDIAMDRVRAGNPQKGIELLMREAVQEKSARARFLRRSQAARIMVEHGLETVAMPILQEMLAQIEQHGLEQWEDGETIAGPLGLMYRCMDRMGIDSSEKEELYLRVCRLDPMQAMSFSPAANGESGV